MTRFGRGLSRRVRIATVVAASGLCLAVALTACSAGEPAASPERTAGTEATNTPIQVSATATPSPPNAPIARAYALMADLPGGGVLLFGGSHGTPPGRALTDLWSFSTATGWRKEVADTGIERPDGVAVDTQSGLAVVVEQNGTWTYDPAAGTWQTLETAERPSNVWGARLAYDAGSNRIILFVGFQTWALDVEAQVWQRMAPAVSPPAQNFHALSYDPVADRVLLFSATAQGGSTWAYDYDTDTWTDLAPATSPPYRIYSALAYDAVGQRTILFGGVDGMERPFGDTWAYDSAANTWTELAPRVAPSPRGWHAMAYDAEAERIVLFSGGETRDTDLADVWLFDPHTDTWSEAE